MFCGNCGEALTARGRFCTSCGSPVQGQGVSGGGTEVASEADRSRPGVSDAPRPMGFGESVRYSYGNYFRFSGRASRSEFWFWALYNVLVILALRLLVIEFAPNLSFLVPCFVLSSVIPNLARVVRRLQDTGKSWPYALVVFIPLVGNILLTVWLCERSNVGANRFGPAALMTRQNQMEAAEIEMGTATEDPQLNRGDQRSMSTRIPVFVAVALVVGAALVVVQANAQFGRLVQVIELSESQMVAANAEWKALSEKTTTNGTWISESAREFHLTESRRIARSFIPRLVVAREEIQGISFFPWNLSHEATRSRYLEHSIAWTDHLELVAENPLADGNDDVEVTWKKFCDNITDSTPFLTFGRYDMRLAKVCTEGS